MGLFVSFVFFRYFSQSKLPDLVKGNESAASSSCDLNIKRLDGFQYIKPLLYAEPNCESVYLSSHKSMLMSMLDSYKTKGDIQTGSIYLRVFKQAQWISINENELYSPGSLLKVPELIAFYKMEEKKPGVLDKKLIYEKPFVTHRNINFESKHIELGKSYTIRELLRYMIVHSDNEATMMLNQIVDRNLFNKVFSDVGLKEPDFNSRDYPMNAADYSVFFKELYNGTYLNYEHSEACMKLLTETDFKEGFLSALPAGIKVAHKFGEGGPDTAPNFSESAIIYLGNQPYLLTVMLKGRDIKKLPLVTRDISRKVFEIMAAQG